MHPIFIPWCAGTSRHRHTNHCGPNNYSRESKERCRAGACPQPGEWRGIQTTTEPFDQPMHPIFIPWCAGTSRHRPATPTTVARTTTAEGRRRDVGLGLVPSQGEWRGIQTTTEPFDQPMHPIFIPWCAGTSRHRPATPTTVARTTTAEGRRRDVGLGLVPSQGEWRGIQTTTEPFDQPMHPIFIPWCAGTSRHRPATPTTVARTTTAEGRRKDVGLGLVPSQGSGVGYRRPLNPSINQCTQFSYLGVPAPAGTGRRHQPLWPELRQPRVEGEM